MPAIKHHEESYAAASLGTGGGGVVSPIRQRQPGSRRRHVLVVSADAATREEARRALHRPGAETDLVTTSDAAAARTAVSTGQVDVVFVDIQPGNPEGLALLAEMRSRHPGALRVAIAEPDGEAALNGAAIAHRLIPRSHVWSAIRTYVDHSDALLASMQDERIRLLVGGVDSLPTVPRLYAALTRILAEPHVTIDDVARLVSEDVGVTAKILQLVNSPLLGISRQVTTMRAAVAVLGTSTIRTLVLATEAVRAFASSDRTAAMTMERLQLHSLAVASLATRLLPERLDPEEVFTAAVLHDIGKLLLLDRCPELFAYLGRTADQRGVPLHRVELEVLGVSHAEIGAYLMHLWQLPDTIITAVASHHIPSRPSATELAFVIHVADALQHGRNPATPLGTEARLDRESLQRFRVEDRLPVWMAMASRLGVRSYPA
jgi:putative nucleotidyltransferase with HDIG domain